MSVDRLPIEPIVTNHRIQFLSAEQLNRLQEATLLVLETTGVRFPSEKALAIFEEHGAHVDREKQLVRLPRSMVRQAMSSVPPTFRVGARDPSLGFDLRPGKTYFCVDGCGVEVVDPLTGQMRPSRKEDVARTAKIVDYLSSTAFYWPMVGSQDYGRASSLHDLDASWSNTAKHVKTETLLGETPTRYAIEMATVIAGSKEALRANPVMSVLICTIAPLVQDKEGIEGAMLLAQEGIPVSFMAMPTLGTTAPATQAGAFVVGDAEIISATVLMQLVNPGAPVSHSLLHGWIDPRSGNYLAYPVDGRARYGVVDIAHHWGMPCFGGSFGTESVKPGTWQSAAEVALDPLLISLAGCEWTTGLGLNRSFTLLYPEAIILDDELYQRARYALAEEEISPETLALDVIDQVGPGGHYLSQKHTRKHLRQAVKLGLTHVPAESGKYRDPVEVAREKFDWIMENYEPPPLEDAQRRELDKILAAGTREIDAQDGD
jgi:trimethylamine--corrinoid protein Co-methyltransferase